MSPTQFHDQITQHAIKRETNNGLCTPQLKINKDSHFIKKSPSSSSSASSSSLVNGLAPTIANKPQQRQRPVIIYTHSPKVIHTHPRDFMTLVQKLTGISHFEDDGLPPKPTSEPGTNTTDPEDHMNHEGMINDDNESTSVVTDENNGSSSIGDAQVNSCFIPPIFNPPNPCFNNFPFLTQNSTDFSCLTQPIYNYPDNLYFMPNVRSSISSATFESMKEYPEF